MLAAASAALLLATAALCARSFFANQGFIGKSVWEEPEGRNVMGADEAGAQWSAGGILLYRHPSTEPHGEWHWYRVRQRAIAYPRQPRAWPLSGCGVAFFRSEMARPGYTVTEYVVAITVPLPLLTAVAALGLHCSCRRRKPAVGFPLDPAPTPVPSTAETPCPTSPTK